MLRQHSRSADEPRPEPTDAGTPLELEAVRVRNHDHHAGHSVNVTLEGPDGETRLTDRAYLAPGQSTGVSDIIDPGRYRLRVRVDGVERRRADLELDETLAGTAVVDLGNGVVSVTEGV